MAMLRSIFAATDLSRPARRAADRAARLAQSASASLTLVHVVSGSALDELRRKIDTGGGMCESILEDSARRVHELGAELALRNGITVAERIATGHVVDEIVRIAREGKADLVVTGTLGAGFFRNRLVGSTAERVVKKSSSPVLMVRQTPHETYRRVLVPVDLSEWSGPSVEIAAAVAPDADFVLMHMVEVPFEGRLRLAGVTDAAIDAYRITARNQAEPRMRELADRAGLKPGRWTTITPGGTRPWIEILRQEQEQDCDLIVIGKRGRTAVEELLLGSTTNSVIAESTSDVLIGTRRDV